MSSGNLRWIPMSGPVGNSAAQGRQNYNMAVFERQLTSILTRYGVFQSTCRLYSCRTVGSLFIKSTVNLRLFRGNTSLNSKRVVEIPTRCSVLGFRAAKIHDNYERIQRFWFGGMKLMFPKPQQKKRVMSYLCYRRTLGIQGPQNKTNR